MSPDGLTVCSSAFGPRETMHRLVAAVTNHGMAILGRIDHADGAAKVGLKLRPTEVLIFGNPKAGTPLMQAVQTMGIDLPLRALIWEDGEGRTWLAYNEPKWLAARHGVDNETERILGAMTSALAEVAKEATIGGAPA